MKAENHHKGSVECGKVLLILSDQCKYYFHSLRYTEGAGKPIEYDACSHIGMMVDSFIIRTKDNLRLSYYIGLHSVMFYFPIYGSQELDVPIFVENNGKSEITVSFEFGAKEFELRPGDTRDITDELKELLAYYMD